MKVLLLKNQTLNEIKFFLIIWIKCNLTMLFRTFFMPDFHVTVLFGVIHKLLLLKMDKSEKHSLDDEERGFEIFFKKLKYAIFDVLAILE